MNFTHLVGNTPMIRIRYKLDGREGFVWAKLEAYNLSGSIKDRRPTSLPSPPPTAP